MCSGQESKSRKNTRIRSTFNRTKIGSINNFYAVHWPLILGLVLFVVGFDCQILSNEISVAALCISAELVEREVAMAMFFTRCKRNFSPRFA